MISQHKNTQILVGHLMAEGEGCEACGDMHDGDFYRFCRCTCHDRAARNGNFP